jgi:hypothetical protein
MVISHNNDGRVSLTIVEPPDDVAEIGVTVIQ